MFFIKESLIEKCCTDSLIREIDNFLLKKADRAYDAIRFGFKDKTDYDAVERLYVYREILERLYNQNTINISQITLQSKIKKIISK